LQVDCLSATFSLTSAAVLADNVDASGALLASISDNITQTLLSCLDGVVLTQVVWSIDRW
jgi:hypothetical protein